MEGEHAINGIVEKYFLDPVLFTDRVKGQSDLLLVLGLATETKVKLFKVFLCELCRFLHPYAGYTLDRLQLLRVIHARKHQL